MGEVFLAQDTRLDRKVALKILPPEFADDKDRMARFVLEAKSVSALNHPNIITIHEIGEQNGTHFITTEFIDGLTLGDYAKSKSLDYKTVLEIAVQVMSALDEAHSAGIIHRDIKPDNIMNLYGPQAALIAESFTPRLRYSGAGLGYQLASIVAGGPAPFIAAALFAAFHSGYAVAFYILGCSVISIVATSLLTDHTNKDISHG